MTNLVGPSTIFVAYGAVLLSCLMLFWRVSWIGEIAPLGILKPLRRVMLDPPLLMLSSDVGRLIAPSSLTAFDSGDGLR